MIFPRGPTQRTNAHSSFEKNDPVEDTATSTIGAIADTMSAVAA